MRLLLLFLLVLPLVSNAQYNIAYTVTVKRLKALADNCDGGAPFCLNAPQDPVFNMWTTDGGGNENTYCWIFEDDNDAGYGIWKDIQNLEIANETGVNTNYINIDMSGFESDNLSPGCSDAIGDDAVYQRQLVQQFDLSAIPQGQVYSTTVDLDGVYYAEIDIYWEDLNAGLTILDDNTSFKLAPNPSNGQFNITFEGNEITAFNVAVLDLAGRAVYTEQVQGSSAQIDLMDENPGVYFVRIDVEGISRVQRIVIK